MATIVSKSHISNTIQAGKVVVVSNCRLGLNEYK